jgi:hypothetical protein
MFLFVTGEIFWTMQNENVPTMETDFSVPACIFDI